MKIIINLTLLLLFLIPNRGYSQQTDRKQQQSTDSTERRRVNHYRRTLNIDSVKAQQVTKIQDAYKTSMNSLMQEKGLNQAAKGQRIKALMTEKNRKLAALLTPEQQARVIPTTERLPAKQQ